MLKTLCIIARVISGGDDPILTAIAKTFNVPEDELVWGPPYCDVGETQIYHWVDKKQKIAEEVERERKESEAVTTSS